MQEAAEEKEDKKLVIGRKWNESWERGNLLQLLFFFLFLFLRFLFAFNSLFTPKFQTDDHECGRRWRWLKAIKCNETDNHCSWREDYKMPSKRLFKANGLERQTPYAIKKKKKNKKKVKEKEERSVKKKLVLLAESLPFFFSIFFFLGPTCCRLLLTAICKSTSYLLRIFRHLIMCPLPHLLFLLLLLATSVIVLRLKAQDTWTTSTHTYMKK